MPECLAGEPPLADYERAREEPSERRTRSGSDREPAWYVLWTHSHCERLVYDQLAAKGFDLLLPEIEVWAMRSGVRYRSRVPIFPGLSFPAPVRSMPTVTLRCARARGLVRILGERWDRLAVVPDTEIDAIEKLMRSHLSVLAHPYLRAGQRVRITRGPLTDIEGILVRNNSDKGMVVLSVHLLHRSVAVEVDCTMVATA